MKLLKALVLLGILTGGLPCSALRPPGLALSVILEGRYGTQSKHVSLLWELWCALCHPARSIVFSQQYFTARNVFPVSLRVFQCHYGLSST